jgi:hypothetical protein
MTSWLTSADLRALAEPRWAPASTWHCVYCGVSTPAGAVDHFIPRARGGVDLPWNLVPACPFHNRAKSDHDPVRWMQAVGVPASTIEDLQTITRSPDWTRAQWRYPRPITLDTTAGDRLAQGKLPRPLPNNLAEVFVLNAPAWAPVTSLRSIAAAYLIDAGRPPISSQQLNRDLESRGLFRTKRKGVYGYRGIYVTAEAAQVGRLAAGSATTAAARRQARFRDRMAAPAEWAADGGRGWGTYGD